MGLSSFMQLFDDLNIPWNALEQVAKSYQIIAQSSRQLLKYGIFSP